MKLKKAYYPKWFAWFILIILVPIMSVLEYEAFLGKEPYPLMGIVTGFMFITIIIVMFLISYRKIPFMYIEK